MAKRRGPTPPKDGVPLGDVNTLLNAVSADLKIQRDVWDNKQFNLAPRFRSFSFFNARETVVSKMIAALLNPEGTHGQGRVFLDLFLKEIGKPKATEYLKNKVTVRSVTVEDQIEDKGRIDVVVSFTDGFNLAIESKVFNASEQTGQMSRYLKELAGRGRYFLLFLTDDKGTFTSMTTEELELYGGNIFATKAKPFIKSWLEKCSKQRGCQIPKLFQFFEDFSDYIEQGEDTTFMASAIVRKSVAKQVSSSPAAFRAAMAIRDHFDGAIHETLGRFLEKIYSNLERQLPKSGLLPSWKLSRHTELWPADDEKPQSTHDVGPFNTDTEIGVYRYVGIEKKGFVAVIIELGFNDPRFLRFGVSLIVRKVGTLTKTAAGWGAKSTLTKPQDNALIAALQKFNATTLGILRKGKGAYSDRYWFLEFNSDFELGNPTKRDDAAVQFCSLVTNPQDKTIDNLAGLMITLAKEASAAVGK